VGIFGPPIKDFDGGFDYWDSSLTLEDGVSLAFNHVKTGLRPRPVDKNGYRATSVTTVHLFHSCIDPLLQHCHSHSTLLSQVGRNTASKLKRSKTMNTLNSSSRSLLQSAIQLTRSNVARRGMASGKEIRFGVEGRAAMLKGVDLLADAVQVSFFCAGGHAVV
jgi:hypothetical protein